MIFEDKINNLVNNSPISEVHNTAMIPMVMAAVILIFSLVLVIRQPNDRKKTVIMIYSLLFTSLCMFVHFAIKNPVLDKFSSWKQGEYSLQMGNGLARVAILKEQPCSRTFHKEVKLPDGITKYQKDKENICICHIGLIECDSSQTFDQCLVNIKKNFDLILKD